MDKIYALMRNKLNIQQASDENKKLSEELQLKNSAIKKSEYTVQLLDASNKAMKRTI